MNTKTMFAISALCAAVAFQASAVESDIVGYQNKGQQAGAFSRIVCFDGVASEAMNIQDIIPNVPAGEELYSGAFGIMTLTPGTATDKTYLYVTAADAVDIDGVAMAGWFNDGLDTRLTGDDAVTFAPGEGFLVLSDFDDVTITFAGKVAKGDTIVQIAAGANFCGNNALQPLDIQSIAIGTECDAAGNISTPVEDLYSGAFGIMTLTPGTATDKTYLYVTATDAVDIDGVATAGWFNDGLDTRLTGDDAVSFEAGEGFLVLSDFDEAYIKVLGNVIAE